MLQLKKGILLRGMSPCMVPALIIADEVFYSLNKNLVITSVMDGTHQYNSKHLCGEAFDLRIFHLSKHELSRVVEMLRVALYNNYNVILEKDHIHIELDEMLNDGNAD